MKQIIVYLPPEHRTDWFPNFARHLCHDILEYRGDVELMYAKPLRKCNSTSFPIYQFLDGSEVLLHMFSIAFQSFDTQKINIVTTHHRLIDLFTAWKYPYEYVKNVFTGHYRLEGIIHNHAQIVKRLGLDGPFNHEIYKPWFFRPESWEEVEKYAGQFDPQTAERKLYFRGVQSGARKCLEHFPSDPDLNIIWGTFAKNNKIQQSEYYKELLKHRVSLSIPGAGDMCHRDIECFGMGVPMVRPRFTSKLVAPIPDNAYIPVDFEEVDPVPTWAESWPWYPKYPDKLAADLVQKFREVVNNEELLLETARNGLNYHNEICSWPNIGYATADMLDLANL